MIFNKFEMRVIEKEFPEMLSVGVSTEGNPLVALKFAPSVKVIKAPRGFVVRVRCTEAVPEGDYGALWSTLSLALLDAFRHGLELTKR